VFIPDRLNILTS